MVPGCISWEGVAFHHLPGEAGGYTGYAGFGNH